MIADATPMAADECMKNGFNDKSTIGRPPHPQNVLAISTRGWERPDIASVEWWVFAHKRSEPRIPRT